MKYRHEGRNQGITVLIPQSIEEIVDHYLPSGLQEEKERALCSWIDELHGEKNVVEMSVRERVDLSEIKRKLYDGAEGSDES